MKNLELTVKERVLFSSILPEQGSKIEMMLVGDMAAKMAFTPAEVSEISLRDTPTGVTWDRTNEHTYTFEISDEQISLLKKYSAEADSANKVTQLNLSLLQKIDEL